MTEIEDRVRERMKEGGRKNFTGKIKEINRWIGSNVGLGHGENDDVYVSYCGSSESPYESWKITEGKEVVFLARKAYKKHYGPYVSIEIYRPGNWEQKFEEFYKEAINRERLSREERESKKEADLRSRFGIE